MSEKFDKELSAVMTAYHSAAERVATVPIKETFNGETVWEGVVSTYDLKIHPVKRAYAWSYKDDKGEMQYVIVSNTPPVVDPITAVRASIMASRQSKDKASRKISGAAGIQFAKANLDEVAKDSSGWGILHRDRKTGQYWKQWYPNSEQHGGGDPVFVQVTEEEAKRLFKLS